MASLLNRKPKADDSGLSLTVGVGVHSLLLSLIGKTLEQEDIIFPIRYIGKGEVRGECTS